MIGIKDSIRGKEKKIDYVPILAFIGFYFLEELSAVIGYALPLNSLGYRETIVWLITKVIPLVLILVLYRKRFGSLIKDTGKGFGKFLIYSVISFVVFYAFELGASYYELLMDKLFNVGEASNQEAIYEFFKDPSTVNYVLLFITIVILAPLLEEFEYRELVFKMFKGCHFIIPVIVSATLFGLAHTLSYIIAGDYKQLLYFPVYALPGLCLALIYHYSNNNFYASFLVHMTTNLISFASIISQLNQVIPTTGV